MFLWHSAPSICGRAPVAFFKRCSTMETYAQPSRFPRCLVPRGTRSALCPTGCPSSAPFALPEPSGFLEDLNPSAGPSGRFSLAALRQMAAISRGLGAASNGLLGLFRPAWTQGAGVPGPVPAQRGAARLPRRCCRAAAWSLPPSPRGGPRRTPSPRANSSRSRSAPRRRRSRRRRRARPATGATRTERGRGFGPREPQRSPRPQ